VWRKPSVNPRFRLRAIEAERTLLSHEAGFRILHGRLPALLAPLIDGRRTTADIATALEGTASPAEIWFALSLLQDEGCLDEGCADEPASIAAFRSLWGVSAKILARRRASTTIALSAAGSLSIEPLASLLLSLGVRVGTRGDLTVVLTDDYLSGELTETDRRQRARGRPWLPLKPVGSVIWLGPLMTPGKRPCWHCVRERLLSNRPEHAWLARRRAEEEASACRPSIAMLASTYQSALGIAATQIMRWIATRTADPLADCLITFDLHSPGSERHHVVPLPGCRTCTNATAKRCTPRPIVIRRGPVVSRDNGYRVVAPEDTVARLRFLISPITGIIGGLDCRTGDRSLVHFYVADHVFEPALSQRDGDRTGFRHLSAGKGMTATQAQASALCEAIERYSGVFRGDQPVVHGRLGEVPGAIHPNRCLNFSSRQYRARRNGDTAPHTWVPEAFDERAAIDWAPLWSLTARTWRHLPAAYCYYGCRDRNGHRYCRPDSNGCAAGNTREEAILQAFLELVERDAVAIWWYNRVRRPGVALETFPGPYFDLLAAHYRRLRRTMQVLDLTTDLRVPTFVALSRQLPPGRPDLIVGAGTHFDPSVAVARALTEMNQFLPAALAGRLQPVLHAPRAGPRFLEPDPRQAPRQFSDFPAPPASDVGALVRRCVGLAAERGLETLVLDQMRPDIGVPVVRVVVPGLRHFYPRLGRGRLYDVPVTLGWLDRRRREDALNPVPFFL
jgi:bacteriocin biosynthesis cyclodehydratase domain-containing protein